MADEPISEMIARVRDAMVAEPLILASGEFSAQRPVLAQSYAERLARAAFAAIREPTDKMLLVGTDHLNIGATFIRTAWRAMVDEATGE